MGVGKLQSTKLTCLLYSNFDSSTRGFVVLFLTEMECSIFQWGFHFFRTSAERDKNEKIALKNLKILILLRNYLSKVLQKTAEAIFPTILIRHFTRGTSTGNGRVLRK